MKEKEEEAHGEHSKVDCNRIPQKSIPCSEPNITRKAVEKKPSLLDY